MSFELPAARSVARNPSQEELRRWALELLPADRVTLTEFDNVNYQAKTLSRLGPSTFFISDEPVGKPVISRQEAAEWAAKQDAYIADQDMVLMEGYIGPEPDFRVGARVFIEKAQSNIAGMQNHLYFPPDDAYEPTFTVIYTPNLSAPGKPSDALIIIDLEAGVTRVFGSDYFGESKMGGLRMWNKLVQDRGGLAMHSGAKTFPAETTPTGEEQLALIIGGSGTGKTTTTFRNVKGSLPVQDDFIALMPGGKVYTSENGCFAKTFGLDPDDEPTIHGGATRSDAWLESVGVDKETGKVDFFDDSYTANGRCTFPMANIRHREPKDLPTADYLFILNRSDNIVPAVSKLDAEQAAYYFMLGETTGTSAGGASEAGKSLRVPGTNPFWFEDESSMGNRFLELLETIDIDVYVLNTGRVGGRDEELSKKVRIPDTAAIQEGIVDGTIEWETDPDFGYQVASSVPGVDPELLQPRKLYERTGRLEAYETRVAQLHEERAAYLERFATLDPRIAKAATKA